MNKNYIDADKKYLENVVFYVDVSEGTANYIYEDPECQTLVSYEKAAKFAHQALLCAGSYNDISYVKPTTISFVKEPNEGATVSFTIIVNGGEGDSCIAMTFESDTYGA